MVWDSRRPPSTRTRGQDHSVITLRGETPPLFGQTKTEMAYHQLRSEIVEGQLAPGTVIDQEAMAHRLGLSTTPVREALRLLESEGLVVMRAHRTTTVAEVNLTQLEQTYAVRLVLDPVAVSLAAIQATDEDLERIQQLSRSVGPASSHRDALHANRLLHRAIYVASHNNVLVEVLDVLWDRSDRYRAVRLHDEAQAETAHLEHQEIVDAIVSKDAVKAAELMRQHVGDGLKHLRSLGE